MPATEVVRRLGHDVAILLEIYTNCIDGQERQIITGSPPLSRPTTTMRHCPRHRPWTLRPSQTRGPEPTR